MELRDIGIKSYIAVLLVVLAVAGAGVYFYTGGVQNTSTDSVKQALELSTNSDLKVLNVKDEGSLDKIVLSDGSNVINAYVTDDRKYLVQVTNQGRVVQGFTHLHNFTQQLQARKDFISCLDQDNATFYGIMSQNRTFRPYTQMSQAQLQLLGGTSALQLFGGTGPQQVQQLVLDFNRTRGVVWQVNGSMRAGLHTVPMLEKLTPCSYSPA